MQVASTCLLLAGFWLGVTVLAHRTGAQDAEPARVRVGAEPKARVSGDGVQGALSSSDLEVRGEALSLLARRGLSSHLEDGQARLVQEQLAENRPARLRKAAAELLYDLVTRDKVPLAAVVALLEDVDPEVREIGRRFLSAYPPRRQLQPALNALLSSAKPATQLDAARVLAGWGDLTGLVGFLRGQEARTRLDPLAGSALEELAKLGPKAVAAAPVLFALGAARPQVLSVLAEMGELPARFDSEILTVVPSARLRSDSGRALGKIVRANPRLIDVLRPRAARFDRLPDPALCVLAEAESLTPELIEQVAARLTQAEANERWEALDLLACAGAQAAGQAPAIRRLLQDPARHVRLRAVAALGELGSAGRLAADELRGWLLDSTDEELREAAAAALGRMGQLREILLPLLEHRDLRLRTLAFEGFVAAGAVASARFASELAARAIEPDPKLALAVLRFLTEFRSAAFLPVPPAATEGLRAKLTSPQVEMRAAAAAALGCVAPPGPDAAAALVRLLDDPEPRVEQQALIALDRCGSGHPPALDRLVDHLAGRSELRGIALATLRSAPELAKRFDAAQLAQVAERGRVSDELLEFVDERMPDLIAKERKETTVALRRWVGRAAAADVPRLQALVWIWVGRAGLLHPPPES